MEELENLLIAYDESKRQECKPVSAKPTLSEMFMEATNQLRGTEMTPEEIRNYTLSRYNVDVIKCMKDINLLTRFSEIKIPKAVAPTRKNSKRYFKTRYGNPKSTRKAGTSKTRRTKLKKRKKSERNRKVAATKKHHRGTTPVGWPKNKKSLPRSHAAEDEKIRSMVSLIRLIRNRTPLRKESGLKEKDCGNRVSFAETNALARPQAPRSSKKKAVGEILAQKDSKDTSEDGGIKTGTNSLCDSEVPTRNAVEIQEKGQDDSKAGLKDSPAKQNGNNSYRSRHKSENKIVKAGYAVKNFIEDLGTKCASGLMFTNQRSSNNKHPGKRDDEEKMEGRVAHENLCTIETDFLLDNLKNGVDSIPSDNKQAADLTIYDAQRNIVNLGSNFEGSKDDKVIADIRPNKGLQGHQSVELESQGHPESNTIMPNQKERANPKQTVSVETSTENMLAVKILQNSRKSSVDDNNVTVGETPKVHRQVRKSKGVAETEEVGLNKATKQTKMKTCRKTTKKILGTEISKGQDKTYLKKHFQEGRESASKQKKRTFCDRPTGSSSLKIKKSAKMDDKKSIARVRFAEDCMEKFNRDNFQDDIYAPNKGSRGRKNRMERLRELVKRRRLKKQVE